MVAEVRLNPYSNGTMYLIIIINLKTSKLMGLNPYSNGTMYLIAAQTVNLLSFESLNPYSNGTMYLIDTTKKQEHWRVMS